MCAVVKNKGLVLCLPGNPFSLNVKTCSEAHSNFYSVGTRSFYLQDKAARAWSWPFTYI